MPSPRSLITSPGLVIFPGGERTVTARPSRCSRSSSKPRSACLRVIRTSAWRSLPSRRKRLCLGLFMVRITFPGICLGVCSLMRSNTISWPVSMPRSMTASSVVSSWVHFSLDGTSSCCCTIIPGPICLCTVRTSLGHRPHLAHRALRSAVSALRQPRQTMRRLILALTLPPLYMSSRLTSKFMRTSGPRLPPPRPRSCSCCPPPKNIENGSMAWRPPPASSFAISATASIPPVS
mmetsp:Transcript_17138/g.46410  ORF Transcript_17138/g.46410 Transcript_17138/m.46410 type:complete len:235 (+) Transcript_17138:504-1208(+)